MLLLYLHYKKFCIFNLIILYQPFGIVCGARGTTYKVCHPYERGTTHIPKIVMFPGTQEKEKKPQGRFSRQMLEVIKMFITNKSSFSFMFYRKSHDYW